MKANDVERKKFDKALDDMIELYEGIEDDEPIISFENDVFVLLEKAKVKYGVRAVNEKVNTVCRAMLTWLPLDDVNLEEDEEEEEETD